MVRDLVACCGATVGREAAANGRFVYAVVTTRIYCRPSCPTPDRRNVRFFPDSAAAEAARFGACKRCRPALVSPLAWRIAAVGKACDMLHRSEHAPPLGALAPTGGEPGGWRVEADETYLGGPRPGKPGRGAGKTTVAGGVESGRGADRRGARGRRLGRLRLAVVPDVSASLQGLLGQNVARPATVSTDGWSGYGGLDAAGYRHAPLNLATTWGDAALRLPAIHLVFGLTKRWLLGIDEFVFRFNRRTASSIAHRFARVIQQAVLTPPTTYRNIIARPAT